MISCRAACPPKGLPNRVGVGHAGVGVSYRGWVGHAGVGGSYRGGVAHAGVGWVMQGWGVVGHVEVQWVMQFMQGWGGLITQFQNSQMDMRGCV